MNLHLRPIDTPLPRSSFEITIPFFVGVTYLFYQMIHVFQYQQYRKQNWKLFTSILTLRHLTRLSEMLRYGNEAKNM